MIKNNSEINWNKEYKKYNPIETLSMPLNVFLDEASKAAGFVDSYFEPKNGLAGMKSAAPLITEHTSEEILSLVEAVSKAHNTYLKNRVDKESNVGIGKKVRAWLKEMRTIMAFAFWPEPGDREKESAYRALMELNRDARTRRHTRIVELSQDVMNYLLLAQKYDRFLKGVPGYDQALLDRGKWFDENMTHVFRGRPAPSKTAATALDQRKRLCTALQQRVRAVRTAAKFVFRDHPGVVKEVTSSFERTRRAKSRVESA